MTTEKKDKLKTEEKSNSPKVNLGKKTQYIVMGIVAALILAGGAIWYFRDSLPQTITRNFMQEEAAATVNGERITVNELDQRVTLAATQPQLQALPADEQRKQILDQMVNEEILFQEAQNQGFTASEEQINTQYDQIVQNFESNEQFEEALQTEGMTTDQLRQNISRQSVLNQYVEDVRQKQNIVVTDEEMSAFYEQATAGQEEGVPPFEEVQDQIQQQLADQKLNDIILQRIDELKESADIKILI